MNEVLLSGLSELSPPDRRKVVTHVMDKGNWARLTKRVRSSQVTAEPSTEPSTQLTPFAVADNAPTKELVTRRTFVMPVPGVNGAQTDALVGKTFVLTGTFPEVGGGSGLNLGKEKVKAMIERFGGRMTTAVSGNTDYLVVGQLPGWNSWDPLLLQFAKFQLACAGVCTCMRVCHCVCLCLCARVLLISIFSNDVIYEIRATESGQGRGAPSRYIDITH